MTKSKALGFLIAVSIAAAMLVGGFSWGDSLIGGLSDGGFF